MTSKDARQVQDQVPYMVPFTSEGDLTERKLIIKTGFAEKQHGVLRHETTNPNICQNLTSKNFKTTKQVRTKEQNHRDAQI